SSYRQSHTESLLYPFPMAARTFSVPTPMRVECNARDIVRYDVVIASDFRLAGGSTLSSLEELKAMVAAGLRVGLLAMYWFDIDPSRHTFTEKLRVLINDGRDDVLVHGQNVECDLLIARYPPVLQNIHRYIPKVRA